MDSRSNSTNSHTSLSEDNNYGALICYALRYDRLYFIDKPETWADFHGASEQNMWQYYEYSLQELCEHFMENVLPHIYTYPLSEQQRHLLKLLDRHPGFHTTQEGFRKNAELDRINFQVDMYRESNTITPMDTESGDEATLNDEDVDLQRQVVIDSHGASGPLFNQCQSACLSKENAALLSMFLTSDADLPMCQLLSMEELKNGLRAAKTAFAKNGQQFDNVKCTAETLREKLQTLCELKKAINELMLKSV